jgi:hypothetical protein
MVNFTVAVVMGKGSGYASRLGKNFTAPAIVRAMRINTHSLKPRTGQFFVAKFYKTTKNQNKILISNRSQDIIQPLGKCNSHISPKTPPRPKVSARLFAHPPSRAENPTPPIDKSPKPRHIPFSFRISGGGPQHDHSARPDRAGF